MPEPRRTFAYRLQPGELPISPEEMERARSMYENYRVAFRDRQGNLLSRQGPGAPYWEDFLQAYAERWRPNSYRYPRPRAMMVRGAEQGIVDGMGIHAYQTDPAINLQYTLQELVDQEMRSLEEFQKSGPPPQRRPYR